MINSIEEAGYEAAAADGVRNGGQKENKNKRMGLRRGKWTTEEENYANRLITEFKSGFVNAASDHDFTGTDSIPGMQTSPLNADKHCRFCFCQSASYVIISCVIISAPFPASFM